MRIANLGQALFAATLIALGLQGLVTADFPAIWQPVPKDLPARDALALFCALVSLGGGLGLLWRRAARPAAAILLVCLLLLLAAARLPALVKAPASPETWEGCGETVVIVAGAMTLYGSLRPARLLYGLAMIPFGIAHFAYLKETAGLVPAWLPWPTAWAAGTGCAYIAAGLAVLSGIQAPLAALLSAVQMGLFTLLVWLPVLAAPGAKSAFQWNETMISLTLTAAGWVVAESYRSASARFSAASSTGSIKS
jgi:uncharacterized membrane protein